MASLVERNKRYYVVYSYEDEKGEKKQKWEGFNTRADAIRRKSEVEYRKEVGSVIIPQCETMNELLKEYIAMYGRFEILRNTLRFQNQPKSREISGLLKH